MSFKKPERPLTAEEWRVLRDAAVAAGGHYLVEYTAAATGHAPQEIADYYSERCNRIWDVLDGLRSEYYKNHPEENPGREEEGK